MQERTMVVCFLPVFINIFSTVSYFLHVSTILYSVLYIHRKLGDGLKIFEEI